MMCQICHITASDVAALTIADEINAGSTLSPTIVCACMDSLTSDFSSRQIDGINLHETSD